MPADPARLTTANAILRTYAPSCELEAGSNGLYLAWVDFRGDPKRFRWVPRSRGSDFPTISRMVPFGGTCTVATMELARWARGLPVRPLGMWRYMVTIGMPVLALELAEGNGWPAQVPCVFCSRLLGDGVAYDHYHREGWPVGPGCWYAEGCGGKPSKARP